MSKANIGDLIGKPHNFTAKDGTTIHVEPNGVTKGVDTSIIPEVVYREASLGKLFVEETVKAVNEGVTTAKKSSTSKKTEAVATTSSENTTASTNSKK